MTSVESAPVRRATGIPPIQCTPWCADQDGHPSEHSRADQTCWGPNHYVELSVEEVVIEDTGSGPGVFEPRIGPCGYREFNRPPNVYLHLDLPGIGVDTLCKMTPAEARALAAHLLTVADEIEEGAR